MTIRKSKNVILKESESSIEEIPIADEEDDTFVPENNDVLLPRSVSRYKAML